MKKADPTGCFVKEGRGYALHLYSGNLFYPSDPQPHEFTIEDIAHSLALQCRYNGHCDYFYSVAQHSVHCYELATDEFKREALLHDSVEALAGGDLPRPIKHILTGYPDFEHSIAKVVHPALGIPVDMSPEIRVIDNIMLSTEKHLIVTKSGHWGDLPEPLNWKTLPGWDPEYAETRFMEAWRSLESIREAA